MSLIEEIRTFYHKFFQFEELKLVTNASQFAMAVSISSIEPTQPLVPNYRHQRYLNFVNSLL